MAGSNMITNDVLGAKLDAVGQRVEKIELKVDNLGTSYVAHDIFELRLKELETQIVGINLELKKLAARGAARMWVLGTGSAVAGALLTYLLQFFLENVGKK